MQEWLDRIMLADLVALYCRGCDRRDFALVRSLYHDDAIDDHGAMFRGGPDAFVAWLPEAMAPWELTVHSLSNSLFAIDGDEAEGEHHVVAYHRTHPPERREYIVHGRYLDRYSRRDGRWKFSHRSLVFDYGEIKQVDEENFARIGADAAHGRANREDPSWQLERLAQRRG
ncbi:nuclear transport factor 2 family protein [Novosphingobium aquimarinum]|uniref:nuclear transport factor 2 family protein n=1 Tax=Novosphingobium aquimarinum TaxID=2682494 RepID=UPI0012EC35F1|nr:nuclear transport factor 2 family protein [Novosphingobium aquimarinum]